MRPITCKMSVEIFVVLFALSACVSGDPDCERRRVSSKDIKIKDGFSYPLPPARGHIYIFHNETTIATGNFKVAPPTFEFNGDVIRMDNASIVTRYFLDIKMEYKCPNESGVFMCCVFYETHEAPDEIEPSSQAAFSTTERRQLRIGVICAVVLWLVVFVVIVMRDPNRDGTPAGCRFIRGQLPTQCPRVDGPD